MLRHHKWVVNALGNGCIIDALGSCSLALGETKTCYQLVAM